MKTSIKREIALKANCMLKWERQLSIFIGFPLVEHDDAPKV
jgi:hypothetical protein